MSNRHSLILPLVALLAVCSPGAAEETHAPSAVLQEELAPAPHPPQAMELASDAAHTSRRTAIVQAAERVGPAVVSISVARRQRAQPRSLFEQFFLPPGYEREVAGLGSGFIVSREGLVVTNEHVVRGADRVVVTLPDGREFDAEILGTDDANDLAVLRLDLQAGEEVPVAPLGSSDQLMVGEWAVAIGNPLGFLLSNHEPAVTAGVVSAVGRNILPSGEDRRTYYLDMIQTDASINPGNSGGPLVNALGEVIGVNSSILSRGGGSEGLGFAIPINRARRVVMDLVESGSVRRAWLGVEVEAAEPGGIRRVQEVRIARVTPGSPAAEAGLSAGSVVREIGGRRVRTPLDWDAGLLDVRVGDVVAVVLDDGRRVRVRAADLPSVGAERVEALQDFELVTVTPAIRGERGIRSEAALSSWGCPMPAGRWGCGRAT
jgi:serine protease Do